jgi:hypothetical protein
MVSRYVSIREAARVTGKSDFNLRKMLRKGYIVGRKMGVKLWMVGLDRDGDVVWVDRVGSVVVNGLDSRCKTGVKSVKGNEEDGC